MKVLLACEESQIVTKAFRALGHEAYSCDIQDCSGGHPEWHFKEDVFEVIKREKFEMMIGFPPCTYLTVSANASFVNNPKRWKARLEALLFVHKLMNVEIDKIAIENPVGAISTHIRKPDQIINPFYFGDNIPKKTCLWLKNLPLLKHSEYNTLFERKTHVQPEYIEYNSKSNKSGKSKYSIPAAKGSGNSKWRSEFFPGVAKAMAEQWT
jgi:hypothetical protein